MKSVLDMSDDERKLYIKTKARNRVYNKIKEQINTIKELKRI